MTQPPVCDRCGDKAWVRIAGSKTPTECLACNPDGAIPWAGGVRSDCTACVMCDQPIPNHLHAEATRSPPPPPPSG